MDTNLIDLVEQYRTGAISQSEYDREYVRLSAPWTIGGVPQSEPDQYQNTRHAEAQAYADRRGNPF